MYSPNSSFDAIHDDGSQSSAGWPLNHSTNCTLSNSKRNLVVSPSASPNQSLHYDCEGRLSRMSIASIKKQQRVALTSSSSVECLRFKYFTTFLVSTTCLALLAASLATNKWLVARPIRIVRLAHGLSSNASNSIQEEDGVITPKAQHNEQDLRVINELLTASATVIKPAQGASARPNDGQMSGGKFQGRIYFGLFSGLKVLNYGFGERVSQLSVAHQFFNSDRGVKAQPASQRHELVQYKSWLLTLFGVLLATLFALIGAIFAMINFVMIPKCNAAGPIGLITWNSAACAACTLSISTWLLEYLTKLKWSVLNPDELQNGWTSENRSQFGYSFYLVCAALLLHLTNIIIVVAVQSNTWTSGKSVNGQKEVDQRGINEGVVMLY